MLSSAWNATISDTFTLQTKLNNEHLLSNLTNFNIKTTQQHGKKSNPNPLQQNT